jgi:hypothetical protein
MQIILIQAEIETAIRNYILSLINLPGQNIEIELIASRGSEGFKAVIDVASGATQAGAVATPAPAPIYIQVPTPRVTPLLTPVPEASIPTPVPTPVPAPAVDTAPTPPPAVAEHVEETVQEEAAPAEDIPVPPPAPSLFKKPFEGFKDRVVPAPIDHVAEAAKHPKMQSLFKGLKRPVNAA